MALDPRLHAARADLADARLKGRVAAARFEPGVTMQVKVFAAPLRKEPQADAMQLTEALFGETLQVFAVKDGFAWAQLTRDGYVGHVPVAALAPVALAPTHHVAVPATLIYPQANLKTTPHRFLPLNAGVTVTGTDGAYAALASGGYVFSAHLRPLTEHHHDFVAVAEQFLGTPYLWGGKTVHGLDCSGLVQVALQSCGKRAPRDSDMQEKELGRSLPQNDRTGLQRGDLVFWDGHVGIMTDATMLLHANGHHMLVASEPLAEAVKRIAASGKPVTSVKRL
ncbi:MAG TPA: NlpC/P60 family protein [Aestuariivirga sp.]|nr:NlpC/P60 family protein [Aestuariivirga sp.]